MENMADSAKATVDYFGKHIVFLNVMRRMSVDCDCAGTSAIDQASIDLVYASPHNKDLVERIESRRGLHQLTAMRDLKMGNDKYELISID